MITCDTLAANITLSCTDRIVGGVGNTLYLINFTDWQNATVTNGSNPYEITALTLASGAFIFKIETSQNNIRPVVEEVKNEGRVRYNHAIPFSIEKDGPAVAEQVEQILLGKYVALVTTNSNSIKVYGADGGLTSEAQVIQDMYDQDGVYQIRLSSDEATLEPYNARFYVGSSSPYNFATALADITAQVSA